jgi:hypothetical protein
MNRSHDFGATIDSFRTLSRSRRTCAQLALELSFTARSSAYASKCKQGSDFRLSLLSLFPSAFLVGSCARVRDALHRFHSCVARRFIQLSEAQYLVASPKRQFKVRNHLIRLGDRSVAAATHRPAFWWAPEPCYVAVILTPGVPKSAVQARTPLPGRRIRWC